MGGCCGNGYAPADVYEQKVKGVQRLFSYTHKMNAAEQRHALANYKWLESHISDPMTPVGTFAIIQDNKWYPGAYKWDRGARRTVGQDTVLVKIPLYFGRQFMRMDQVDVDDSGQWRTLNSPPDGIPVNEGIAWMKSDKSKDNASRVARGDVRSLMKLHYEQADYMTYRSVDDVLLDMARSKDYAIKPRF
jgi:hypothetical protein